jgi:hypothetical protein
MNGATSHVLWPIDSRSESSFPADETALLRIICGFWVY